MTTNSTTFILNHIPETKVFIDLFGMAAYYIRDLSEKRPDTNFLIIERDPDHVKRFEDLFYLNDNVSVKQENGLVWLDFMVKNFSAEWFHGQHFFIQVPNWKNLRLDWSKNDTHFLIYLIRKLSKKGATISVIDTKSEDLFNEKLKNWRFNYHPDVTIYTNYNLSEKKLLCYEFLPDLDQVKEGLLQTIKKHTIHERQAILQYLQNNI